MVFIYARHLFLFLCRQEGNLTNVIVPAESSHLELDVVPLVTGATSEITSGRGNKRLTLVYI